LSAHDYDLDARDLTKGSLGLADVMQEPAFFETQFAPVDLKT
jgi:hypothetical protein